MFLKKWPLSPQISNLEGESSRIVINCFIFLWNRLRATVSSVSKYAWIPQKQFIFVLFEECLWKTLHTEALLLQLYGHLRAWTQGGVHHVLYDVSWKDRHIGAHSNFICLRVFCIKIWLNYLFDHYTSYCHAILDHSSPLQYLLVWTLSFNSVLKASLHILYYTLQRLIWTCLFLS